MIVDSKNQVNKFSVEIKTHTLTWSEENQETQEYLEYCIDGKSLREILANENDNKQFMENYIGLLPRDLHLLSPESILKGEGVLVEENGSIVIYICNTCGELLCSNVACEIEIDYEYVIWKNFMKPIYDNKYTEYKGGPFIFDRTEYEKVIRRDDFYE
jgi:hypothetical protein